MSHFEYHGDLRSYLKRQPITSVLILINTIFLLIIVFTGGFTGNNLIRLGALFNPFIDLGEYYRFLTAIFLHGSFMHYLSNTLFGLAILGATLERYIVSIKYLFVYLLAGLFSSIVIYITTFSLTVGASGAIYGLLGVFLYIIIFRGSYISYQSKIEIRNLILINIIFTFLVPNISIVGHISGLAAGFLIAPILGIKE